MSLILLLFFEYLITALLWIQNLSREHGLVRSLRNTGLLEKKNEFSLSSTEINPMSQCANNRVSEKKSASEALAIWLYNNPRKIQVFKVFHMVILRSQNFI